MNSKVGKFVGALLGLAVGDALGAPFEFKSHVDLRGLGIEDILAGALRFGGGVLRYTDDTLMAIHLAEALIRSKVFDAGEIAEYYYRWYLSGDLRGIGLTTRKALERYGRVRDWRKSGVVDVFAAGNGCAMRVVPIALFDYGSTVRVLYEHVRSDCIITHFNEEAVAGAFAVAIGIRSALDSKNRIKVIDEVIRSLELLGLKNTVYANLLMVKHLVESGETEVSVVVRVIGNSGYVAHSVPLAFWAFAVFDDFEDAVHRAIIAGEDADTHAAITGALKGAEVGANNIPENFKARLENREHLVKLAEELYDLAFRK